MPPAMPRVEAKSQGAPMVTSAATSSGAPRGEPDRQRAAHAVAEHRHRPAGEPARRGERRQQPLARRRRRGRSPPRAGPGAPQSSSSGRKPSRRQPAQQRPAGHEVEHVGAVDQARHHQHRRPVRVGGLGRRAVVEQPRAAGLPDRRRVGEACGGRGAPARSRGRRPSPAAARAISRATSSWSRSPPSAAALGGEARRPRESSGCRRAAPRAAPGRRPTSAAPRWKISGLGSPTRCGAGGCITPAGGPRPATGPSTRRLRRGAAPRGRDRPAPRAARRRAVAPPAPAPRCLGRLAPSCHRRDPRRARHSQLRKSLCRPAARSG